MKRIILFLLLVGMFAGMMSVGVLATDGPTIQVSDAEAAPGDSVTVSVSIVNNPGIACFELTVDYDESKLEWIGIAKGEPEGTWDIAIGESVMWVNSENYSQDGVILVLEFNVLETASGSAEITVSYEVGEIFNEDEVDVDFKVSAGSVAIEGAEERVPGDLNGDGTANALDLLALMKYILGLTELDSSVADVTASKTVDILDVIRLARFLAGKNVELY